MIIQATNGVAAYFSEPLRMSDFKRICWVRFGSADDYQHAL